MGLCKCPKKKVTNLFCFEHKVNVCEHCLVSSHEKCIVKSYLQWLEDSDYNAVCTLCDNKLLEDDMECVRLVCYDVFHLKCLNDMANKLPETTAPAGYECPLCKKPIIPHHNQAGAVVDNLKSKISKTSWFLRTLRIKSSDENDIENFEFIEKSQSEQEQKLLEDQNKDKISQPFKQPEIETTNQNTEQDNCDNKDYSVYQMPDVDQSPNIRKCFTNSKLQELPTAVTYTNTKRNDDENKYSRKPLLTHISTLLKAYFPLSTARRSPQRAYRYFIMTLIVGIILFIVLLWLFSIVGRYSADQDPMLDPRYNPNLEFIKEKQIAPPIRDDKGGIIVRGAVNNIEAPSHNI